jgi:hypothetical protein
MIDTEKHGFKIEARAPQAERLDLENPEVVKSILKDLIVRLFRSTKGFLVRDVSMVNDNVVRMQAFKNVQVSLGHIKIQVEIAYSRSSGVRCGIVIRCPVSFAPGSHIESTFGTILYPYTIKFSDWVDIMESKSQYAEAMAKILQPHLDEAVMRVLNCRNDANACLKALRGR